MQATLGLTAGKSARPVLLEHIRDSMGHHHAPCVLQENIRKRLIRQVKVLALAAQLKPLHCPAVALRLAVFAMQGIAGLMEGYAARAPMDNTRMLMDHQHVQNAHETHFQVRLLQPANPHVFHALLAQFQKLAA